jgi:hypothetical protein
MPGKTFFSSLKQHPLLMKKATCGWLFCARWFLLVAERM